MGVIGGPDGPTAIFIAAAPGGIAALVLLAALGAGIWLFLRRRKK
ncbi:hypothetical protein AALC17_03830 [Oscillospiraceae bacterium 38-13]